MFGAGDTAERIRLCRFVDMGKSWSRLLYELVTYAFVLKNVVTTGNVMANRRENNARAIISSISVYPRSLFGV